MNTPAKNTPVKNTRHLRTAALFVAAFGLTLTSGCGTSMPRISGVTTTDTKSIEAEPNFTDALVVADSGLGASDRLGQYVFVSDNNTRYALSEIVWRMAAAEDPDLQMDAADLFTEPADDFNSQAIVSAEEMRSRRTAQATAEEPSFEPVGQGAEAGADRDVLNQE